MVENPGGRDGQALARVESCGPPRGLTGQDVVDAAAGLADEQGLWALRPRPLADRLGVRPPSLYNYFEGSRLSCASWRCPAGRATVALRSAAVGRAGTDAVVAIADAYRTYARPTPASTRRSRRDSTIRSSSLRATSSVDVVAAALRSWTLEGDDVIHAVRALRSAMHGFVALEAHGAMGMPVDSTPRTGG